MAVGENRSINTNSVKDTDILFKIQEIRGIISLTEQTNVFIHISAEIFMIM
jgi:hypothetical protein